MPQYERISLMNNVKQTFTITIPSKTGYMDLTEDVMECVRRDRKSVGRERVC